MRRLQRTDSLGARWIPKTDTSVAVLLIGGSSGKTEDARAELLCAHGVATETVRWFGGPAQRTDPYLIPLEIFFERIDQLGNEYDRIWVLGSSFGSEAALLSGAHFDIEGVIAVSPSDVTWGTRLSTGDDVPRWTQAETAVPFVPIDWESYDASFDPPSYRSLYESSRLTFPDHVQVATIPVEKIRDVVLIAGGDDRVWPSVDQAQRIVDRRTSFGLRTTLVQDDLAGHTVLFPGEVRPTGGRVMQRGGSDVADRRLGRAGWRAIIDALAANASPE